MFPAAAARISESGMTFSKTTVGQYFPISLLLYIDSLDTVHCEEWMFDLDMLLPTELRSLRAEGHTVSDSLHPWALSRLHTHTHTFTSTYTHSFPNWQWKGFQGKHLIVLLFSVFKLSLPTLMLTDIELCNGGGWHVIFKSKEKRDCVWTEHIVYCVSVSEAIGGKNNMCNSQLT